MPTPKGKPKPDGGTQTKSSSGGGPKSPASPTEPGGGDSGTNLTDVAIIRSLGYDPDETNLKDIPNSELAFAIDSILEEWPDWDMRVVNDDTEDIFTLDKDSTIWDHDGERKLKQISRKALEQYNSKNAYKELVHAAKSNPAWEIEREELGGPEGFLAVDDGLLDLVNRELRDPKPGDYILGSIPTGYEPGASIEGTAFEDYILQSVAPRDREKLQEYAGYCLWHRGQPFKKACFLFGPTDSGKGTFLKTVELILGPENIAWESLYNLIKTRWGRAKLYGRMVNMRNEVTAGGLSNLQLFKELTGGEDKITAENKNEPTFHFRVTQKFLFSTNQFPQLENADEAFFNRCLFVEFPNTVRDEDKDTELLDKFDRERSAILNWMLDGLDRLLDQGHFTGERSADEKRDVTKSFGSPVEQFAYDALEATGDPEDVVNKSELYQAFTRFCDYIHAGETPIQQKVTSGLKEILGVDDGKSRRVSDGDNLDRCMKGIRLQPEFFKKIQADLPTHSYGEEEGGRSGGQTRLD